MSTQKAIKQLLTAGDENAELVQLNQLRDQEASTITRNTAVHGAGQSISRTISEGLVELGDKMKRAPRDG